MTTTMMTTMMTTIMRTTIKIKGIELDLLKKHKKKDSERGLFLLGYNDFSFREVDNEG